METHDYQKIMKVYIDIKVDLFSIEALTRYNEFALPFPDKICQCDEDEECVINNPKWRCQKSRSHVFFDHVQ